MTRKDAILLVANGISQETIGKFHRIRRATESFADSFLLVDSTHADNRDNILIQTASAEIIYFDWDGLKSMGYTPLFDDSIVPGSNHFILLWFYKNNPGYSHYWNIEYDADYAGDWNDLFRDVSGMDGDFLTCCLRKGIDYPDWFWLPAYESDELRVHPSRRIISFNPFFRISNKAAAFLDGFLSRGNTGHHEVVIPTALYFNGFSIVDIGGEGDFVPSGFENRIYTVDHHNPEKGSMRHRPSLHKEELTRFQGLLCHPVKQHTTPYGK